MKLNAAPVGIQTTFIQQGKTTTKHELSEITSKFIDDDVKDNYTIWRNTKRESKLSMRRVPMAKLCPEREGDITTNTSLLA